MSNAVRTIRLGEKFEDTINPETKEVIDKKLLNADDVRLYEITMAAPDKALAIGAKVSRIFFEEEGLQTIKAATDNPQQLQNIASVSLIKALAEDDIMALVKDLLLGSLFVKKGIEGGKIGSIEKFNDWFKDYPQDFLPLAIFVCGCYSSFFMGGEQ